MTDQQPTNETVSNPPELGGGSGVTNLAKLYGVTPTPVVVAAGLTVADADSATEAGWIFEA